jgi:hypothetical protein
MIEMGEIAKGDEAFVNCGEVMELPGVKKPSKSERISFDAITHFDNVSALMPAGRIIYVRFDTRKGARSWTSSGWPQIEKGKE